MSPLSKNQNHIGWRKTKSRQSLSLASSPRMLLIKNQFKKSVFLIKEVDNFLKHFYWLRYTAWPTDPLIECLMSSMFRRVELLKKLRNMNMNTKMAKLCQNFAKFEASENDAALMFLHFRDSVTYGNYVLMKLICWLRHNSQTVSIKFSNIQHISCNLFNWTYFQVSNRFLYNSLKMFNNYNYNIMFILLEFENLCNIYTYWKTFKFLLNISDLIYGSPMNNRIHRKNDGPETKFQQQCNAIRRKLVKALRRSPWINFASVTPIPFVAEELTLLF